MTNDVSEDAPRSGADSGSKESDRPSAGDIESADDADPPGDERTPETTDGPANHVGSPHRQADDQSDGPPSRSDDGSSRSDESPTRLDRARVVLAHLRTHPRAHPIALTLSVVVGLALSWVHWLGLLVAGALIGVFAPSVRRGLLGAVGFGVLALLVFALTLGSSVGPVLAMTPPVYVAIGAAFGLPVFGSLVRGLW